MSGKSKWESISSFDFKCAPARVCVCVCVRFSITHLRRTCSHHLYCSALFVRQHGPVRLHEVDNMWMRRHSIAPLCNLRHFPKHKSWEWISVCVAWRSYFNISSPLLQFCNLRWTLCDCIEWSNFIPYCCICEEYFPHSLDTIFPIRSPVLIQQISWAITIILRK